MIEIKDVSKSFGNKVILDHLHLTIKQGCVFGLIGPNGAGKSTLLRILNGILKADEGSALYNGIDVYENVPVKNDILFISDDPYYFTYATMKEMKEFYQLWYPLFDEGTYQYYLTLFHLDEVKKIKDFSKGMKRLALLCIALAVSPKYLLLDEAFDGLDPMMRLHFKRAVNQCIEEKEMTIIISSHNLRELEDICDSFGILDNGRITTSGDIDQTKSQIHKIQLAFLEQVNKDVFDELDVLSMNLQSRVVNLVVKGDIDEIKEFLSRLSPLMMEILPVNLEEVFIYEMERKGDGINE